MTYDPWDLESRMRERHQRLQQEIDEQRRVAIWRRGAGVRGDRPAQGSWRRAMAAVLRLLRRDAMRAPSEVAREQRGEG